MDHPSGELSSNASGHNCKDDLSSFSLRADVRTQVVGGSAFRALQRAPSGCIRDTLEVNEAGLRVVAIVVYS